MRLWLLALLLAGCAVNPATHEHEFVLMSEEQELNLGKQAAAEIAKQMPLLPPDAPIVQYVAKIGRKVAEASDRPNLFYRFFVVDDPSANAFALPGGFIYVNRGLLVHLNSEAELAAVLGHEIGHVAARHAVKRYTQAQTYQIGAVFAAVFIPGAAQVIGTGITDLLALAVIQGYGRKAELQADRLGLAYAARAGFDPYGMVRVLKTLAHLERIDELEAREAGEKLQRYHGVFASHPETETRIQQIAAAAAGLHDHYAEGHEAYLKAVAGLPYAGSEAQGAVTAGGFIHPKLGIAVRFGEGWHVQNTPQAVVARLAKQKAFARLEVRELVKKQTALDVLRAIAGRKKLEILANNERQGVWEHAAGLVRRASMPHVSRASVVVHVFRRGPQAFVLFFWAPREDFARFQDTFARIAKSFHAYDPARDGVIPRIRLAHWKKGDTWRALAKRLGMPLGRFTAERLAALNGMGVEEVPPAGALIKIVDAHALRAASAAPAR